MSIDEAAELKATVDEHEQLMIMADRELEHRIKALRAAGTVLQTSGAASVLAKNATKPGTATDLIMVADWLVDEIPTPAVDDEE